MRGFTLMEMVISLVVVAILTLSISGFLSLGADGYISTVQRERLQSRAQMVVERMSQELRHAIPNSVSVDGACVRFYPIYYSSFYTDTVSQSVSMIHHAVSSVTAAQLVGKKVAVGFADISQFAAAPEVVSSAVSGHVAELTLTAPLTSSSPAQRIYLFDEQVGFCHRTVDDSLVRVVNTTDVAFSPLLAKQVVSSAFDATRGAVNGSGMIHLYIEMRDDRGDETARFNQSVQVFNVQ